MKFCELDLVMTGKRAGEFSRRNLVRNLKKLRSEVVLNSIFYNDFENSFGIDSHICSDFFDGYMDFLYELECEKYGKDSDMPMPDFFEEFDTIDNLINWYYCHETFGDE